VLKYTILHFMLTTIVFADSASAPYYECFCFRTQCMPKGQCTALWRAWRRGHVCGSRPPSHLVGLEVTGAVCMRLPQGGPYANV
jgi:hypothetical protein